MTEPPEGQGLRCWENRIPEEAQLWSAHSLATADARTLGEKGPRATGCLGPRKRAAPEDTAVTPALNESPELNKGL